MILGIVGSYRKERTIGLAVASVLSAAREKGAETKLVYLHDFNIEFCTNCRRCTQEPGPVPGECHLADDMPALIKEIENADAYVIGAPVNVGNINALTQRFLERLICYSFWPWGQASPNIRKSGAPLKKAVLITSSAMPSITGRLMTGSLRGLKLGAKMIGAKPVATIFIGLSAMQEKTELRKSFLRKAQRSAKKLCCNQDPQ
jgi:FMN-dependent NADH-azoreductase